MPVIRKKTYKNRIFEVTNREIYVECVFKNCAFHGFGATFHNCKFYIPEAAEPRFVDGHGIFVVSEGECNFTDECEYFWD